MTITPTTPADKCREYIAECCGFDGDPAKHDHGLDILRCLPPGWDFEVSTFSWWAYRIEDRFHHREAGEQQVSRTDDKADDAARLVALAWQEHRKEAP